MPHLMFLAFGIQPAAPMAVNDKDQSEAATGIADRERQPDAMDGRSSDPEPLRAIIVRQQSGAGIEKAQSAAHTIDRDAST
jgi:hypothetical protein